MLFQIPVKKETKKEPTTSKASSSKKRAKSGEDEGSSKKRKPKKKKDPNAPKRAMSGFMFFSQLEREVDIHSSLFCRFACIVCMCV